MPSSERAVHSAGRTVIFMTAAIPLPSDGSPDSGPNGSRPQVGDFRQGTSASRWALGRYLVGRAVINYVDRAMYVLAVVILVLGALAWWQVSAWLGVPIVLVGLAVLAVRAL